MQEIPDPSSIMNIISFHPDFCEQASFLAREEFLEEQKVVPVLPKIDTFPWVKRFSENGLGIAAIDGGKLVGFLCGFGPIDGHFGRSKGIFTPIHAHGAVRENRSRIYSLLYQKASELWVKQGIFSHAIALYAHDHLTMDSFFWNGFGLRCVDAISPINNKKLKLHQEYDFFELTVDETEKILPLQNALIRHINQSPVFIPKNQVSKDEFLRDTTTKESRFFCVGNGMGVIGYIEIRSDGENFITRDPNMMNICGAYLLPEYRGEDLFDDLLRFLYQKLADEGYSLLGVDFESCNPLAKNFWLKHFIPYTYSLTRRIDERIFHLDNLEGLP